jgi:hypothetical protein
MIFYMYARPKKNWMEGVRRAMNERNNSDTNGR